MIETQPSLQNDVRWQLIERITASNSFQRSERLKDLLRYLAEQTLQNARDDLGEHQIGVAVFGKPENYSIVEDSSVRVHVRQLRLRLHEYFDSEGRNESCIVEIPKGSYAAVFRTLDKTPELSSSKPAGTHLAMRLLPWGLAALFFATTVIAFLHRAAAPPVPTAPWPLAALFDSGNQPVRVVVADANYGLARMLLIQPLTLQQYLSPEYRSGQLFLTSKGADSNVPLVNYLSRSVLTSFADVSVATALTRLSGDGRDRLVVRSARSLSPRDFDQGNFVLIGSPASNPWVSYFTGVLNFRERMDNGEEDCFLNQRPLPGEPPKYCSPALTGSGGDGYATISLLPLPSGHGSVLILQGLHQEATESTGDFLADAANRRALQKALGMPADSKNSTYFEALIRTESIAGAPVGASSLVSVRLLHL